MNDPKYLFQYCQKLVVFSKDWQSVLLARRSTEADYDGAFSFIGGKLETSDVSLADGLGRETSEEIGPAAVIEVYLGVSHNLLFRKKDGNSMILPHYLAHYLGGGIVLNKTEYSEYRWMPVGKLEALEPKIDNIPACVHWAQALRLTVSPGDYVRLGK